MTDATKPLPQMSGCVCEQGGTSFTEFEIQEVGCDESQGRFAEVTLNLCRTCGRTWLCYLVEYEAFSRSGRWARGLIGANYAKAMTPDSAVAHLNGLEWYLYGGSYFDGISGRRSGAMQWGP